MLAQIQHMVGNIMVQLPPPPENVLQIPHQVLPPDPYFQNRHSELSRLLDGGAMSARGDSVRIVVISGLEGAGKTALAREAKARLGDRFPGGELFVDFAALGRDADGTVSMEEALGWCLQGFGVERRLQPDSLSGRVTMYQSCTAGQRMLVVLDGITEPAQVRALLPMSPGSVVLATSARRRGELVQRDGAEMLTVGPLDAGSARALLTAMAGPDRIAADQEATEELLRICGGLALALRIAATRLVQEPALTVRELVDEIAEEGLDGVEAVLSAAYAALPEETRRAYRLLGAVPMPTFTAWSLAALLDVPQPRARAAMRMLTESNLLTGLPARRYQFPDLVGRNSGRRAGEEPPAAIDAALGRLLESFLARVLFADLLLLHKERLRLVDPAQFCAPGREPFATAGAAEDWLAEEWAGLLAALEIGARRGHVERVWQLAEVLSALTLNTRRPGLVKICDIGVAAATAAGRIDVRARLSALASRGHADLGQYEPADRKSAAAVADADRAGDPVLLASAWEFRGRYFAARRTAAATEGRPDEAETHREAAAEAYRRSLALNEVAGERRGAALAAFFLAEVANGSQRAEYERLLHEFRDGLTPPDRRMAARVQIRLGQEYERAGAVARAVSTLGDAVRFFAESKATHYEAEALEALAGVAERAGDIDGARRALARAAEILDARADKRTDEVRARLSSLDILRPRPPSE
jgi:hypothetical protein